MSATKEFGRDLHHMGVTANFGLEEIADFMIKRGWQKGAAAKMVSTLIFEPGSIVVAGDQDPQATAREVAARIVSETRRGS